MHVLFAKVIFGISILFIIGGAFNDGFTKFYLAIPFAIIAIFISLKVFKNYRIFRTVIILCVMAVLINLSLEINPFVYPILRNGTITINKDGYLRTFSDGSGGFYEIDLDDFSCSGCGEIKFKKILKGETYPVIGVHITHPDFSTKINLVTPIGQFSENNYSSDRSISINKKEKNQLFTYIGALMAYPFAYFILKDAFNEVWSSVKPNPIDASSNSSNPQKESSHQSSILSLGLIKNVDLDQKIEVGRNFEYNGCTFEFEDVGSDLKIETIHSIPPPANASSMEQIFYACFAHTDRNLQARNNQRNRIEAGRALFKCQKYGGDFCRTYGSYCLPMADNSSRTSILQVGWTGKPCSDIYSLSQPTN